MKRFLLATALCSLLASTPAFCFYQSGPQHDRPQEGGQAPASGGVNTGGAHAAVYDQEHRPITAGGFVKSGALVFEDDSRKAGLDSWTHTMGTPEKRFIIEANGSGVALIDYDNDGWLDIYLVNGSTYDALAGKRPAPKAALFHNNHDGTFTNVADKAGVTNERWGFGAAVADYDNDGWPDIYISNFGKNRLYHNNHDGTFTDVAEKAGVTLGNWSTGATWGDYDGDGHLDLFVPGYVHYDVATAPAPDKKDTMNAFCQFRGQDVMCGPRGLKGEPDHLFHNNGNGTFTDVSEKAGVADKSGYYGLSSAFVDVNNDGKVDLLVADDSTPNYLYLNKGDGTFDDISYASGYALNEGGRETASMGIAIGDFRNIGRVDLYNTTFSDDYNPFYRNDGDANFTDISYQLGLAEPTVPFLGWGDAAIDYDNDGWKDLITANGHVYPVVDRMPWGTSYAQRPLLFHNVDGKKFDPVPAVEGSGLARVVAGHGLAVGDLFNDGKLDAVINVLDSHPLLLRNMSANKHHWIELKLIGGPKSPRDAVGATVYLTANGQKQRGDVIAGGSYDSTHDPRIHFGLGDATTIESVEVHWPSGNVQRFTSLQPDRIVLLTEGKDTAE
ncbi:CRTAC1 family protein [Edaphobacter sp. 12200R-103]|uniref:CRTAC1 family protein n=1 Tax=Edaphobacter sp. 12200R-103 TaxID=2703788 RepID=UPI00138D5E77|nr:CRTAC1 family protein [Edaphobacter sp. 12200R-103]QHS51919.1 CRTAC1 family protein [Edaphobacter sp. 12200R-103]